METEQEIFLKIPMAVGSCQKVVSAFPQNRGNIVGGTSKAPLSETPIKQRWDSSQDSQG